jgi:hypothetical protein
VGCRKLGLGITLYMYRLKDYKHIMIQKEGCMFDSDLRKTTW